MRVKTLEDLVSKLGNDTSSDRNRNASEIGIVPDQLVHDLFGEFNNLRDETNILREKIENCSTINARNLNILKEKIENFSTKNSSLTSAPMEEKESTTREEMEKMKLDLKKVQVMTKLNGKSKLDLI